jgi:hypothetical protein
MAIRHGPGDSNEDSLSQNPGGMRWYTNGTPYPDAWRDAAVMRFTLGSAAEAWPFAVHAAHESGSGRTRTPNRFASWAAVKRIADIVLAEPRKPLKVTGSDVEDAPAAATTGSLTSLRWR